MEAGSSHSPVRALLRIIIIAASILAAFIIGAYVLSSSPEPNRETIVTTIETEPHQEENKPPSLRLMAVGDVMLGRNVGNLLQGDYSKPFAGVRPILAEADILFGNLECPLTDRGMRIEGKQIVLKASPAAAQALSCAGFTVVSLANNHIMDYQEPGLLQTMELLDNEGILYCGAGRDLDEARRPAIIEHLGTRAAFLAYTDMYDVYYSFHNRYKAGAGTDKAGVAPRLLDYIIEDITGLRDSVDIIIISLHWGIEESFEVSSDMVDFARCLIDAGADAILGHHPHQLQAIEIYKNKPIAYSLGNFIFDQNDDENKESLILDLVYEGSQLVSLEAIPLRIVDKNRVVPAPDGQREIIQNRLVKLSGKMGTKAHIIGDIICYNINGSCGI